MLAANAVLQNRYLIIRPIGEGGMGAVYLAKDQRLGSSVALKETLFSDPGWRKAFEREAKLLANLNHPALPKVIDHFAEADGQFLVMEYIPGDDLGEILKRIERPLPVANVLGWADQLLEVLSYLHTRQQPIIHRDIKPQNLKVNERGQIILLDFGLAKGAPVPMSQGLSSSIFGYTRSYSPLEQIQGAGTDPRSDLYALGATLYHLMTGTTPPDALSRVTAVLNGQTDLLRPANDVNPNVPNSVASVVTEAMALRREERPVGARQMRAALDDAARTQTTILRPRAVVAPAAVGALLGVEQVENIHMGTNAHSASEVTPQRFQIQLSATQPPLRRDKPLMLFEQPVSTSNWMPKLIAGLASLLIIIVAVVLIANRKSDTAALEAAMKPKAEVIPSRPEVNKNIVTTRGAVDNISDGPLENLSIEVELQRGGDRSPEVRRVSITPSPVLPGQRGTFEFQYDGKRVNAYTIRKLFSNANEVRFRESGQNTELKNAQEATPSTLSLASLNAQVTSLRFFNSGCDDRQNRDYKNSFSQSEARCINWELQLRHSGSSQGVNYFLDEVLYRSDGTIVGRSSQAAYIGPGSTNAYHTHSWGWNQPGSWQPDSYRVELSVEGQKIAGGSFEIYSSETVQVAPQVETKRDELGPTGVPTVGSRPKSDEIFGTSIIARTVGVRIYNCDDAGRILLDGREIVRVGLGEDSGVVDITPSVGKYIDARPSKLTFEAINSGGSVTYGFEVWDHGRIRAAQHCGTVYRIGCKDNAEYVTGPAVRWTITVAR